MLAVVEPEHDWAPLARVYNHLKQTAAPSRNKLERLVRASDLFELGLRLMDTCEEADRPQYVPIRYRDGLIIALLRLPDAPQEHDRPGHRAAPDF
jgi:integrase/recombinase XerD